MADWKYPSILEIGTVTGLTLRAVVWALEERATSQPAVKWIAETFPADQWLLWLGIFLAGLLAHDVFNQRSWLWHDIRRLFRSFDVIASPVERHEYKNEPRRRLDFNVHIKFTRRVRNGRMMLRVFSYAGPKEKPRETPFDLAPLLNKERGDSMKLCLYRLPIPYEGWELWEAGWAPDHPNEGRRSWQPGIDGVVVVLELENGWLPKQQHRFYLSHLDYKDGNYRPHLFAIDEESDLFDVRERYA